MNPKDRITRLEALLERVQGRTLDVRELAETIGSPSSDETLHAEDVTLDAELDDDTNDDTDDTNDDTDDKPAAETGWSIPVPRAELPHATNGVSGAGLSGVPEVLQPDLQVNPPSDPMLLVGDDATNLDDYEVAETVELDGDGDDDAIHHSKAPPPASPPVAAVPSNLPEENLLESRQRLVSAASLEADEDDDNEPRSIPLVQRRPSQIPSDFMAGDPSEPASPRSPAQEPESLGELELLEEAPPSSRRPIAQQRSDLDDFEQDLVPSPPPESGRQIAVQDSAHFEEDFVGGAMPMLEAPPMDDMAIALEPVSAVIPVPQDAMEMVLPKAQSPGEFTRSFDDRPRPPADATFGPLPSTRAGLGPEIVSADLVPTSRVAVHGGAPPSFTPSTFGELLDAALGL